MEGEKVVTRFTMSGTHSGDFDGLAPTNKKVMATGVLLSRYDNGKPNGVMREASLEWFKKQICRSISC